MKLFKFAAVAAVFFLPASAQAGVFSSLLSFDGSVDVVEDDSVGSFVEKGVVDGILEVGDLLQGMIAFDPIDGNTTPAGSSVIGAYSLEVKSIGAGGTSLVLGAAAGADSITSLLGTAGVDMNGLVGSGMDGFAVLESTTADVSQRSDFTGPSFGFSGAVTAADFKAVTLLGFDGVDDTHIVTSFGSDLTDLSGIAGLAGTGATVAIFNGTYSVTDHAFGAGVTFLPLFNVLNGGSGDVIITNGTIAATDANTTGLGWDFNDDGDFNINAVPEPTSMLIFAGLGLVGFMRRRNG